MNYLLRRGFTLIITLLLISIFAFILFQLIPGDPAMTILGLDAEQGQIEALRSQMGLDLPVTQRYLKWMVNVFKGDLGQSVHFSMPVKELIGSRLPVTLSLAVMAIGIATIVAIPLGILSAKAHGKCVDIVISIFTQLGMAIPSFWLGIILIYLFGLKLEWFAPGEYIPWSESIWGALWTLLLPSIAIAIPVIAVLVRYLRTSLLEQLKLDYVRTAYSKGLKEKAIVYKHVFKNALIPVVTIMGMIITSVLGGSLVVEQVFSLPGLGRLLISSIQYRDFLLIQGMVMYIAVAVILVNFLIDILYKVLDPRIQMK
ncbi:ABC transporter permease [Crassaminicella profunda]|uniref:ABC transporter permease n=1 Tax=Crassaminicella profunda TaxID=1286698 RepID=UPI001CA6FAAB|nr:ABC transporter permease [Crassaminicella profunda]QZY53730.1 ABC transporter permease [Crassaminicella profunda]